MTAGAAGTGRRTAGAAGTDLGTNGSACPGRTG
jgi:hypothetical protein